MLAFAYGSATLAIENILYGLDVQFLVKTDAVLEKACDIVLVRNGTNERFHLLERGSAVGIILVGIVLKRSSRSSEPKSGCKKCHRKQQAYYSL